MTQYTMSADGAEGVEPGERVLDGPPTIDDVEAFGAELGADRVVVSGEDLVSLYVPSASGEWWPLCSGVDEDTADEMRMWDDLIRLIDEVEASDDHPLLAELPPVAGTPVDADEAVRLVRARIRRQRLDYPVDELVADRIAAGWNVYAPVDVAEDEDDIAAFLEMPVGRSAFLVSDLGRVKEVTSSMPPGLADLMFGAEEAFVRRPLGGDPFAAAFWDEFERLSSAEGQVADVTIVDDGLEDRAAALAAGLITPIAQQLSLLGPRGWTRFEAQFSSTVSAETGRLRFWVGEDVHDTPVPEQMALLVRRQRSLAALLPAGPWWRLVLLVDLSTPGNAGVITQYDYGDEPIPADLLLTPDDYRRDLASYPRAEVPGWLTRYIGEAPNAPEAPQTPPANQASKSVPPPAQASAATSTAPAPATPTPTKQPGPVLDTRHDMNRLYADDTEITFGRHSLALDDVRWVRYPVVQVATKRFMFPTTYDTYYHFGIGTHTDSPKKLGDIKFLRLRKNSTPPEIWLFLVDLVQRRVEPRLLTEYAEAVERGQTVSIAGLSIAPTGISASGFSLRWDEVGETQVAEGRVRVFQKNAANPVFQARLGDGNAVLLPTLLAYLSQ